MIPKEKAKQLLESMEFSCRECDYESKAKQCALIAVNEMIEHCNYANKWYWQEVKQEIEKL